MAFLIALVVDGALAGAVYALIALGFAVVYKASRVVNFALGECMMLGALLTAAGVHVLALGLPGALLAAGAGMVGLALTFNRAVLRPLVGGPVIALLMVTLGLGAFVRGAAALVFRGMPASIPLPLPEGVVDLGGVRMPLDRLVAGLVAGVAVAVVASLFRWSRTGIALRAIADDDRAAMAVGIDVHQHLGIAWGTLGVVAVVAGVLWGVVGSGGAGVVLVGLKVFPVVIIGGLDSIPATIVAAMLIGILESLVTGYVDPLVGGGFGTIGAFLIALAFLFFRPAGLLGGPEVRRV